MTISPSLGLSSVASIASSVVLPEPLGPTKAMNSPFATDIETPSTAWVSPLSAL